jgi:ferrochelatase
MKYQGPETFSHTQPDKIGILITNLGTPEKPTTKHLRIYLKEFLSDPRVVEVPRLIWWLILNLVILRIRPRRSAKSYQKVWTDKGSPLLINTQDQADTLRQKLTSNMGEHVIVEYAMRYGSPSISNTINKLQSQGVRQLLVLPLYPQYSATTTASTFDAVAEDFKKRRWIPELRFVTHYHDNEHYISASATQIANYWQKNGKPQKLLFSYHGVPKRYLTNGDPYHCECHKTSRLIAEKLGIGDDQWITTFQSRFGREEWLTPYTDETLKELPAKGVTDVQIFCPGFSADCLETIEEIGIENRDYFIEAGGQKYNYIPALNAEPHHIEALSKIIQTHLQGWQKPNQTSREKLAMQVGAKL